MAWKEGNCAVAGSLSSDFESDPIQIVGQGPIYTTGSISLYWTGSPVGDFAVQGSNENTGANEVPSESSWITYTGSTQAAGGASGSFRYDFDSFTTKWVRVIYTSTSGSGSLNATYLIKTIV